MESGRVYLSLFRVSSSPPLCLSPGSQWVQSGMLDAAVSALAWLSPQVLVSGAEDGTLRGWLLEESALQSLWLLPGNQKPVLGLATSPQLLASASGTPERQGFPEAVFSRSLMWSFSWYFMCEFVQMGVVFTHCKVLRMHLSSPIILDLFFSFPTSLSGTSAPPVAPLHFCLWRENL